MKLFAIFNLATAVFGLDCLTCHGRDQGDCEANGRTVTCQEKVIKYYNIIDRFGIRINSEMSCCLPLTRK